MTELYRPPPEYWDEARQHHAVIFERRRLPVPWLSRIAMLACKITFDRWYSHNQQATCEYTGINTRWILDRVMPSRYVALNIVWPSADTPAHVFRYQLAPGSEELRVYRQLQQPPSAGSNLEALAAGLYWTAANLSHEGSQRRYQLDTPDKADYDAALAELRSGAALFKDNK